MSAESGKGPPVHPIEIETGTGSQTKHKRNARSKTYSSLTKLEDHLSKTSLFFSLTASCLGAGRRSGARREKLAERN